MQVDVFHLNDTAAACLGSLVSIFDPSAQGGVLLCFHMLGVTLC